MEKEENRDKKIRCFVAMEIPAEIKKKIAPLLDELHIQGVKPVAVQNMHVTLKFLGYVSRDTLEKIKQALARVHFSAFSFSIKGIGCFPSEKRPRVVWIGCESLEIQTLAEQINQLLAPFFPKEAFTTHLTVARVKDMKSIETKGNIHKFIAKHKNAVFGTTLCKEFVLKESKLQKSGSIYMTLKTFPLQ